MTRTDQLKAMSEPLRIRIVEALVQREMTIAELAKQLEQPPSKLYHHVDVLLAAELIQVTRRIQRRGAEERWLRAVAKDYSVDDSMFAFDSAEEPGPEAMIEMTRSVFDGVIEDVTEAARSRTIDQTRPGRRYFLETLPLRLTETDFADLCRRLDQWIADAKARSEGRARGSYRFVTAFFPTRRSGSRSARSP